MTPSLAEVALGDLAHELDTTRAVLARLPGDRLGWRPHERSMSLGELGAHVANLLSWGVMTVKQDGYDMASGESAPVPSSVEELLQRFDGLRSDLDAALAAADDAVLQGSWTLRHGEHRIFSLPKVQVFRSFVINHSIHHRAQLTVYLRLLGEPVPAVYGPSADER